MSTPPRAHASTFGLVIRVLACLAVFAAPSAAQEVTGRLQAREPARPLTGVAVTANRASDGTLVARTLTGARGEFLLPVTTDSLIIRALRIGQQPVVLAELRLAAGERRRIETDLPDAPVALAVHRTRATDRCQRRTEDGDVVGKLFYAARAAILATGASSSVGSPRSSYRLVKEQWNARGDRVDSLTTIETWEVEALQPFRSVPVDSLLADGWLLPQPDGSTLYRGLDAEVLLDDAFLARYCLRLASDSAAAPDLVGVQFQPARRIRGRVDIEGVLWLDRETFALRTLAFRYTELEPVAASTNPGGTIAFASLSSGAWFISEWSLRMPLVYRRVDVAPRSMGDPTPVISERRTLVGRLEQAGQVLWVETDGRLQFLRPERLPPQNGVTFPMDEGGQSCRLHGQLRSDDGSPLPNVVLELLEHTGTLAVDAPRLLDIARTDSTGRFALCSAGGLRPTIVRTSAESRGVDSLVVGPVASAGLHGLTLVWSQTGFVVPVALAVDHAPVVAAEDSTAIVQGDRTEVDTLTPPRDSASVAGAPDHAHAPSAAAVRASSSWLLVTDRDSISIPFATVTIEGGNRRVTTLDGRVPLPAGARGPIGLEIRRIGYAPFVGRVAPDSIDGSYRVQLLRTEQTLAAVEVVAPRETSLSRTGFYDRAERVRRGAIVGAFLTPEEIERRAFGSASNLLTGMQYIWMGTSGAPTGRGGCAYQVLIDGMPATVPLRTLSANEVMGVEVYPSTANAPVELIPVTDRGSCGIIAIWLGPRR